MNGTKCPQTIQGSDTMNGIDIIGAGIFIIGLGVFLGMVLALFAITFETMLEFFDDKLTRFKKRLKQKWSD